MIQLRVLGGLSVALTDGRLPNPAAVQPRRLAVLAIVARGGTRGISREKVMSLLWPDADEEAARRGLTQALSALRGGLDAPELCLGVQSLRLNPDVVWCDVLQVEQALAESDLDQAAALHTGPFLDGFRIPGAPEFDRWIEEERASIGHRMDEVLEELAAREAGRGNTATAVKWWRRRAATDPFNARVAVALMRALAANGDRAGAIAHARVHEALVREELDAEPDVTVVSLANELRLPPSESVAALNLPVVNQETVAPELPAAPDAATASVVAPPTAADSEQRVDALAVPTVVDESHKKRPFSGVASTFSRWRIAGLATSALAILAFVQTRRGPEQTPPRVLSAPLRVTSEEGLELDAAVSPDGQRVAYAAEVDGRLRLMLRQRTGSRALTVARGGDDDQRRPRWSPDGTQLLFEAKRGIWVVPALGGSARLVVTPPADMAHSAVGVTWSPDGESLAWVQGDTVFTRKLAGGSPKAIAHVEDAWALSWSPDGRWIAGASGNSYFQYGNAPDSKFRRKGVGILANLSPSMLVLMPAHCTAICDVHKLTSRTELNTSPEWLDKDRLVFVSSRGGARDLFVQSITRDGAAADEPQRLTSGLDVMNVSVASDGATIAYSVFHQTSNIWSLPLDSARAAAGPRQVTHGTFTIEAVDVSLDGSSLAFDANTLGQQDIYTVHLKDGRAINDEVERIVDNPVDDFHPSWSPDARWLAYYTFVGNVRRAAVIAVGGGEGKLIHQGASKPEEHSPVWTADGNALLFFRTIGDRHQLFETTRRPDNSWAPERQITQRGGYSPTTAKSGLIAYFIGIGDIYVMPAERDENRSRLIYRSPTPPNPGVVPGNVRFDPDGTRLIIKGMDEIGSGVWTLPIEGGVPRLIARLDDVQRPSLRPEFGTDGRYFYYTRVERGADIWSMQLKR